jgi:hypothetical protein
MTESQSHLRGGCRVATGSALFGRVRPSSAAATFAGLNALVHLEIQPDWVLVAPGNRGTPANGRQGASRTSGNTPHATHNTLSSSGRS